MSKASMTVHREELATLTTDGQSESPATSSLIPMLVGGLIMVVIGMLFVVAIA